MSRPVLSLFRLDRGALSAFTAELRGLLARDDRPGLSTFLGLGEELARRCDEQLAGARKRIEDALAAGDDDES